MREKVTRLKSEWKLQRNNRIKALKLNLKRSKARLNRLTDAYLDGVIEKELFENQKQAVLTAKKESEEKLGQLMDQTISAPRILAKFLELAKSAYTSYKMGLPEEKRELLRIVTSNREVAGKKLLIKLSLPFNLVASRFKYANGGAQRDTVRTWDRLLPLLIKNLPLEGTFTSSASQARPQT